MYFGSNVHGANYLWTKVDRTKTRWTKCIVQTDTWTKKQWTKIIWTKIIGTKLTLD